MKLVSVFFGTSAFAMPSLRAFAQATDCRLVVTQPDRPSGRGQRLQPTPIKVAAQELGIETIEPVKVQDALDRLREVSADLNAVASYGKIIPQQILDLPRLGALNVHPSLLPLYRGATPLQAQLRDGVTESGVTIILMDAGMDTGDIVMQERRAIGLEETYGELHDRFAELGATLLARACEAAARGELQPTPQTGLADPEQIAKTATKPLTSSDLQLDWRWPAKRIIDFVRSLSPQPGARAMLCGEGIKILKASPVTRALARLRVSEEAKPGTLGGCVNKAAIVRCGDGLVAIDRLVPPNRSPMDGRAFALPHLSRRGIA